jgi:GAF domain-containing protein
MSEPTGELARLQALVAEEAFGSAGTAGWLSGLCRTATRELPAAGVAMSLMTKEGLWATVAASDPASKAVEELQFTLGEGPCLDAFAAGRPVLVSDLAQDGVGSWPVYCSNAQGRGVHSVFAMPMQIGAARLGIMDVFREQVGPLSAAALAQALAFAELATLSLLNGQERAGDGHAAGLDGALDASFAVYQAQGMVMVQLGVSLAEALARIRGYAYANDRGVGSVARDILGRTLILEGDQR